MGLDLGTALGVVFPGVTGATAGAALLGGGLDYLGAEKDREAQERANAQNIAMQREFAQMGIRWKVEDARAAGIHPLAALGAQGASFNAQIMPESSGDKYRALSGMGQNISRAIQSGQTHEERIATQLRLQNMGLQNELLKAQISSITNPNNPPFPGTDLGINVPGQGNSRNTIQEVPVRRTASIPGAPYADMGHVADFGFVRTPHGLAIVPSKDVKERVEDQIIPETMWAIRNMMLPNMPGNHFPKPTTREFPIPEHFRKKGYNSWRWSYTLQQFVPSRGSRIKDYFGGN